MSIDSIPKENWQEGWTLREAAAALHLTERRVRDLAERGKLATYQPWGPGSTRRVKEPELRRLEQRGFRIDWTKLP